LLLVHSPVWVDKPGPDWINVWSSGTSFVYQDHAALWNTLRLMGGGFVLPQDSRKLVEGVYDEDLKLVPNGLRRQTDKYLGLELARAMQGSMSAIKPDVPYQAEGVPMWDDTVAPTRLGESVLEWVLCQDGQLINGSVAESSIQLRKSTISSAPTAEIVVGPWQKVLNLTDGRAECHGSKGVKVVTYDKLRGLSY
jgi:CRISPR-associated endonuclease/helicase Cas3